MDLTHLSVCVLLLVFVSLQIQIRQTYHSATSALKLEVPQFELLHSELLQRKVESFGLIYKPSSEAITISTANITMAMLRFKRLGKQIWLFRWFAFYETVLSLPWISDDQIQSALLDMYGTETFVHETGQM